MPRAPIRLLIVIIDLAGGTGTFCRALATGLKKFFSGEFEISLLILRGTAPPEEKQFFDHIHTINSDVHRDWRRMIETPAHLLRLSKAINCINPDLILTVNTYSNLLVPLAAPRRHTILTVHSNSTQQLAESRFRRIISILMRLIYPRHSLVAPTHGVAEDLADNFDIKRTHVIPHGIDIESIRSQAQHEPDDLLQSPYIIAVGRLTPAKDYPTLLHAYSDAQSKGLEEHLLIIGDGELRDSLLKLSTDLGLSQHVHFLGHRPNPFPYIKHARFFILSSIWEGFGLALLEALALGLPAISTDCPSGPAEILADGEYGLLVKPGDVSGLAEAMLQMSRSSQLREAFSKKATERAQQLSLGRMAQSYRDLFLRELEA
ncbi:MAG TPA: glycosyltransferase [Tepidisphaeraceae bacterium]|jgi:glycosyltransferase involved in cell wall biosynthesis|nr:glycosyltransferase [Tepidisphaeraceae bacterium]